METLPIGSRTLGQLLRPKFHLRIAGVFILAIVILGYVGFTRHGVYRAYFGGLAVLAAAALIVQYRRERAVVHNRLSAVGVVTDYRIPLRSGPRIFRILASKFSPEIPLIKYSFVAFDQKSYTGETGWGTSGLYKGAQITVLYNPENPARNHPLTSLVFYSFGSR
ncbi:MAG: hypothetical protein ACHQLQ_03655 [Candidatus Acidiferrales bacterium]